MSNVILYLRAATSCFASCTNLSLALETKLFLIFLLFRKSSILTNRIWILIGGFSLSFIIVLYQGFATAFVFHTNSQLPFCECLLREHLEGQEKALGKILKLLLVCKIFLLMEFKIEEACELAGYSYWGPNVMLHCLVSLSSWDPKVPRIQNDTQAPTHFDSADTLIFLMFFAVEEDGM